MSPNQLKWLLTLALLCGVTGVAPGAPGPEEQPWSDYQVLVERNMFSRVRGPRASRPEQPVQREAPPPERFIFLRGIVRRDGETIAVLEDMSGGRIMRVRSGDTVLDGRVGQVTLDEITYLDAEGKEVTVPLGRNLETGSVVPSAGEPEAGAPAGSETDEGEASGILERLRQRRMRELGQ